MTTNRATILEEAFNVEIPYKYLQYLLPDASYTEPSTTNTTIVMVTTLKTIGPSKTKSRNSKNLKVTTPLKASPDTVQPHYGPLLGIVGERVETRGCVDLMTTFGQGRLSRSFTVRFLNVDADTFYFALISWKMLSELGAIVSTPHLKMKFPTLTGEIVTVKADQKQARQCYDESLKVAPHPSTRESGKPHPTSGGSSQVMNMDEESSIRTLVVYKATRRDQDDVFDVDLYGNTANKGPIPIEELVKLQLGPCWTSGLRYLKKGGLN